MKIPIKEVLEWPFASLQPNKIFLISNSVLYRPAI